MKYNIVFFNKERISVLDIEYVSHQVEYMLGKKPTTLLVLDKKRYEEFLASEDEVDFILVDSLFYGENLVEDDYVHETRSRFPCAEIGSFSSRSFNKDLYDFVIHHTLYKEGMCDLAKRIVEKMKLE